MSTAAADIDSPVPDLEALERLARHIDLAQTGRLEELFEEMQRSRMPYEPLVTAQVCALSIALWELRGNEIEELGNRTLSLFGLRGRAAREDESWIAEAFKGEFPRTLGRGLASFYEGVQKERRAPEPLELERLLLMAVPGLALRNLAALEVPSGLSLSEHVVGREPLGDLPHPFLVCWDLPPGPDEVALEGCRQALLEAQREHGYATLPNDIDRRALARTVYATLESRAAELNEDLPF